MSFQIIGNIKPGHLFVLHWKHNELYSTLRKTQTINLIEGTQNKPFDMGTKAGSNTYISVYMNTQNQTAKPHPCPIEHHEWLKQFYELYIETEMVGIHSKGFPKMLLETVSETEKTHLKWNKYPQ